MSLLVFFMGLTMIIVSYLWAHWFGRIADPSMCLDRDDAKFLGKVTGVYIVIAAAVWLLNGW